MVIEFLLPNNKVFCDPYDFYGLIDKNTFNYYLHLKALEYNVDVVKDFELLREKEGIDSQKLRFEILGSIKRVIEDTPSVKKHFSVDAFYLGLLDQILGELKLPSLNELAQKTNSTLSYLNIHNTYQHKYIKPYALVEILLFNMITVKCDTESLPMIYWIPNIHESGLQSIDIRLNAYIPKQRLHDYIDNIYDSEIKPALKHVEAKMEDPFFLTEKDLLILDARKNGVKFREIADLLEKENIDAFAYEDKVKSAHRRAMAKVNSL